MAGICCGVVGESETSAAIKRTTKRRKPEIRQINFVAEAAVQPSENDVKRQKLEVYHRSAFPKTEKCAEEARAEETKARARARARDFDLKQQSLNTKREANKSMEVVVQEENPKFGMTSVCGRRRDMEDSVAIHPSFCRQSRRSRRDSHFFGVYDGHGCSHVAMKCKAGLHQIVKEELEIGGDGGGGGGEGEGEVYWKEAMSRSFSRMDKEVHEWSNSNSGLISNCRCELQTPQCDAVGSTAVVAVVTPNKIVVSNCGDSRAVLCRGGVAIPLSSDHKPDRPDELKRIETAGGRVIYWDGARVLGVLAMSRAIGDNYLKPYVISEPEVTVNDRTAEDEFIILASDGLWDVVTNETACCVVRMCLNLAASRAARFVGGPCFDGGESSDKACLDASILLTKLALARHSSDNVSVVVIDLRRDI